MHASQHPRMKKTKDSSLFSPVHGEQKYVLVCVVCFETVRRHWDGVIRWQKSKINNGILEGLNSVLQAAKRKARGYERN